MVLLLLLRLPPACAAAAVARPAESAETVRVRVCARGFSAVCPSVLRVRVFSVNMGMFCLFVCLLQDLVRRSMHIRVAPRVLLAPQQYVVSRFMVQNCPVLTCARA